MEYYRGDRKLVVLIKGKIIGYIIMNLYKEAINWQRLHLKNGKALVV